MKIKSTLPVRGRWNLAVIDGDYTEALLLPIVCWALVDGENADDDKYVAMVVDPDSSEPGVLTPAWAFEERVLGVASPNDGSVDWHEIAQARFADEREKEVREHTSEIADRIIRKGLITATECDHLNAFLDEVLMKDERKSFQPSIVLKFVSLRLIEARQDDDDDDLTSQKWVFTDLGRQVFRRLNKIPIDRVTPG